MMQKRELVSTRPPRVVVTNLGSDRNKGDSAILSCLLDRLGELAPDVDIRLVSAFGWGDRRFRSEYFHTRTLLPGPGPAFPDVLPEGPSDPDRLLGSVFPIVPVERAARRPGIAALAGLLEALFYTARAAALALRLPLPGPVFTAAEIRTMKAFRQADLVISNGGGFVFGERGLRATVRLFRVLFPCLLARASGVPYVLYGQSFGPFAHRLQTRLVRRVLNGSPAVRAREEVSCRTLREIGVKSPVKAVPDLAFGLTPSPAPEAFDFMARYGLADGRVLAGMTVRDYRFRTRDPSGQARRVETYVASMAAAIDAVHEKTGAHWVLWPQCTGFTPHEDDRLMSRRVRDACRCPGAVTVIEDEMPPPLLKACYAQMQVFIATRFHSAVFALTGFVPTLVVSYWGPKARGTMAGLGLDDYLFSIEDLSPQTFAAAAVELWNRREETRSHLRSRMPPVVEASRCLDPVVARLIEP